MRVTVREMNAALSFLKADPHSNCLKSMIPELNEIISLCLLKKLQFLDFSEETGFWRLVKNLASEYESWRRSEGERVFRLRSRRSLTS